MSDADKRPLTAVILSIVIVAGLLAVYKFGFNPTRPPAPSDDDKENPDRSTSGSSDGPLVVYCAHDAIFSKKVLDDFVTETGIDISVRYDSELTKSLGLTELIIKEKDNPRCDVFWNNQLLGTADLLKHDVLEPYKGPGWQRIPDQYKDPNGAYTGFAARLRVYIVNTEKVEPNQGAIQKAIEADLSRVAIAKPMYGTTLTHYSVLWNLWGPHKIKQWHADWRKRGVIEADGNAKTKNLTAEGVCYVGFTDTDDYFVAKDDGKPVAMAPVRVGDNKVILIPNTVAIIKGTKKRERAQQLVDYLLSQQLELTLAKSKARQIPLGPVDESKLSDEVKQLKAYVKDGYSLVGLEKDRDECLQWLKLEYVK